MGWHATQMDEHELARRKMEWERSGLRPKLKWIDEVGDELKYCEWSLRIGSHGGRSRENPRLIQGCSAEEEEEEEEEEEDDDL